MGLGIDIQAGYVGTEEECRARICAFLEKEPTVGPGKPVSILAYDRALRASFFFAEEDVYFLFEDSGRVDISAKTNCAGPGYHAHIVSVLDRLRDACGLAWNDSVEDETGYWLSRDFDELQEAMAGWLETLADMLVENHMDEDVSRLAICMSTERVPDDDCQYAAHLLGWLDREFFLSIVHKGATRADCENFFIWWDKEPLPSFHLKCALCMLWCDCNWLPPVTEQETRLFTSILLCLETAWDGDIALPYPVAEWKEIATLSGSHEILEELGRRFPEEPLSSEPIGYLRGRVRFSLGNGWRMSLPGTMHEDTEGDNGNVLVFWDAERTVRITLFSVRGDAVSAASLLNVISEDVMPTEDFVLDNQSSALARIAHGRRKDEDGEYGVTFFFAAVNAGHVLDVNVYYEREEDRVWAEQALATCS